MLGQFSVAVRILLMFQKNFGLEIRQFFSRLTRPVYSRNEQESLSVCPLGDEGTRECSI